MPSDMLRNYWREITVAVGNLGAWLAGSEGIWFSVVASYPQLASLYDLPDLRGPMAFITLVYAGLRLGDLWNARERLVGDTMEGS